jgi:hypothetical protein
MRRQARISLYLILLHVPVQLSKVYPCAPDALDGLPGRGHERVWRDPRRIRLTMEEKEVKLG